MKIIAKSNFAGLKFNAIVGQELNLPDDIAEDLIRAKLAEVSNEDKRDNAGTDSESAPRKRASTKRNRA